MFPWRSINDPYDILVSEIMLQQTQAERVVPKYEEFISKFPTVDSLVHARFSAVLRKWQGLGYNRRAQLLQETCRVIRNKYDGHFPETVEDLENLPGVGPYTAAAIMAFAYNKPVVMIETNIRSVFIYSFFRTKKTVPDKDILPLIAQTMERRNPRLWYSALMDYGAHLKKLYGNPSRKSAHHIAQSKFEGSNRQLRGAVIRVLLQKSMTISEIAFSCKEAEKRVRPVVDRLLSEGMVKKKGVRYAIA